MKKAPPCGAGLGGALRAVSAEKTKHLNRKGAKGAKEKSLCVLCAFAVQKSFNATSLLKR
jgi:hypothetical protein